MSELSTQIEVLTFLQENLFDYQMNYLRSNLMTFDEVMEYLPEEKKVEYFHHNGYYNDWKKRDDYEKKHGSLKGFVRVFDEKNVRKMLTTDFGSAFNDQGKPCLGKDKINDHFFIVTHDPKDVHSFNKNLLPKFTFKYDKNILICNYIRKRKDISHARWARIDMHTEVREINIKFDLKKNIIHSYDDDTYNIDIVKNVGSWYDSQYENWRRDHPREDD